MRREIQTLRNAIAQYEQEIARLKSALQSYRWQLAAAQRQRDAAAAQKIDAINRRHRVIEQARLKQAAQNREAARQIQLIDAKAVAEAAYRQVVDALASARAELAHARRQIDAGLAAWQDSQNYFQGAAFVMEFGGGGDLSAQLAPFEGVGLGASLNTALSVSGRLDLDAQGVPASFTLSSSGEATLQAQANFGIGIQGAALVGFETERLFVFENGRYREIGEAWLTLLIDVHAQGGAGAFVTANAGAGQRLSLKIDMLQFQNHFEAFEHLMRYGDAAPLERALANTAFTLSLQSRWTAGVAAGFDVSVAGNGVNFSADFTWTDKGAVSAIEFTAEEGIQHLMHPDRIAEIGAALGAHLSNEPVAQADDAYVRIQNRWQPDQHLHIEYGQIASGPIQPGWWSAQWQVTPVANTPYVRIQNRWQPDQHLHIEYGQLESGAIQEGWWSAQWQVTPVANTPYVRIQNRWYPDQYLHIEYGQIASGPIQPGWWSAQWTVQ